MTLLLVLATLFGLDRERPVDFDTEVVPVLTRHGCNAGACHGAAIGRGGFKLSLLGDDPARDYEAIVHDLEGRRINLTRPDDSLLLTKPTGRIDHEGGLRLAARGEAADRLRRWIGAGAPRLNSRRLSRLDVTPTRRIVAKDETEVPLRVDARFDDGSVEDVTRLTVFTPSDPSAVAIRREGTTARALVSRGGQNILVARFLDRVVPIELIVPLGDRAIDLSHEPRRDGLIDEAVLALLATMRLPVSPQADDAASLRRVRLDLTGRLPAPDEVRSFQSDRDPSRIERLVDRLLASEDFNEFWTFRLATMLRVRSPANDAEGTLAFHAWLREQVGRGTPFDVLSRTLLIATGDTHHNGPANFSRVAADARAQAEHVAQVFLGVRLQCANCHNHPLDRWTQDDYHGLAAIFARLDRGREVKVLATGEVTNPRTGEPALLRLPGARFLDPAEEGRTALADWLTDPGNPGFARAIVNRLWQGMMGRGLVEPADDLRATNPATHPELLDALAADFVAHGHDLRHTLRRIATSATYARSPIATEENRGDDRFYSHAMARPLVAEVLADALADVTGVSERFGDQPEGARAIALADPRVRSEALEVLGRCPRQDACDPSTTSAAGLAAKLHLLNGALVNRKLDAPGGRLQRLLAAGRSDDEIVDEFYLRALVRAPSDPERAFWRHRLGQAKIPQERESILEDFVWSLLNSREFLTNH
jgi:hypothetical protein